MSVRPRPWKCSRCNEIHRLDALKSVDDACIDTALDEFERHESESRQALVHYAYAELQNEISRRGELWDDPQVQEEDECLVE